LKGGEVKKSWKRELFPSGHIVWEKGEGKEVAPSLWRQRGKKSEIEAERCKLPCAVCRREGGRKKETLC